MNGRDTWLKLHTSLLLSKKFRSLPDGDHRWAFVGCLMLQKKGFKCELNSDFAHLLMLSLRKWRKIRSKLVSVGLLDEDGTVKSFEESQLSPAAIRKRRQRERDRGCDKSRQKSREIVEVEVEPPKSPPKEVVTAAALCSIYNEVLRPPRNRGVTKDLTKRVKSLLRSYKEEELGMVMRYRLQQEWWRDKDPTKVMSPTGFGEDLETARNQTLWNDQMEKL